MRIQGLVLLATLWGCWSCFGIRDTLASSPPVGPYPQCSEDAVDCDCTIAVDRAALQTGWVQIQFHWGPQQEGRRQLGCTPQAMGGGTIELLHNGAIIHTVATDPMSQVSPPYFSHSFPLDPRYRSSSGQFAVRAHHATWNSNEVEFSLSPEREPAAQQGTSVNH